MLGFDMFELLSGKEGFINLFIPAVYGLILMKKVKKGDRFIFLFSWPSPAVQFYSSNKINLFPFTRSFTVTQAKPRNIDNRPLNPACRNPKKYAILYRYSNCFTC
jgi:hypothetical protein